MAAWIVYIYNETRGAMFAAYAHTHKHISQSMGNAFARNYSHKMCDVAICVMWLLLWPVALLCCMKVMMSCARVCYMCWLCFVVCRFCYGNKTRIMGKTIKLPSPSNARLPLVRSCPAVQEAKRNRNAITGVMFIKFCNCSKLQSLQHIGAVVLLVVVCCWLAGGRGVRS